MKPACAPSGPGCRHRWRRDRNARACVVSVAVWLAACVSLELPTFAHVHVGHAVTGWPDTPDQQGLLDAALRDAETAAEHAAFAVENARDVAGVKAHLGHVLHAVDPALEPHGPGSGFGLVKALSGSVEHLGFAQEAKDASPNLKAGLGGVIETLVAQRRDAQVLAAMTRDARRASDAAEAVAYAHDVKLRAERLAARVADARRRLAVVLAAESPPYRPVARRYLFGIIRLPSGDWIFAPASRSGGYH
ncbi:MAG: hypothetical protein IT390_18560 [Nitrospira sp.]|nr:hypothetical protein [Nitrospira sp.]